MARRLLVGAVDARRWDQPIARHVSSVADYSSCFMLHDKLHRVRSEGCLGRTYGMASV